MLSYPMPESWKHATVRQRERASRSFAQLRRRSVPVYGGPLLVDDDENAHLREAANVAQRAMVLWTVTLHADNIAQREVFEILEKNSLWGEVSPTEEIFLKTSNPPPEERRRFTWRLESIWVLLWSLGYIQELSWPSEMCSVPKVAAIMESQEGNRGFVERARLRPLSDLLDAQDLVMRIHWAIRNSAGSIPDTLDWSCNGEHTALQDCAAVAVVEERHHALNWLVGFPRPNSWDAVDTPT